MGICMHVCVRPEVDVMCLSQLSYNVRMEEEFHMELTLILLSAGLVSKLALGSCESALTMLGL